MAKTFGPQPAVSPIGLRLLLLAYACLVMDIAQAVNSPYRTLDGRPPLVIGHRGAPGYLPEHTLASYRRAIVAGADFIEPDLVSTKDGELIARHEVNITATTDIAAHPEFAGRRKSKLIDGILEHGWFADDFTLAEIKILRATQALSFRSKAFDGRYEIPTLEEIIRLVERESASLRRTIGIYPETKHPGYHSRVGLALEPPLIAVLERHGLNTRDAPVMIQSFEVANLKTLRKRTPVRLVQLIDASGIAADGTLIPGRPNDFVLSGDRRTYADLVTKAGLKEIATYADGVAPWKRYLIGVAAIRMTGGETDADKKLLRPSEFVQNAHHAGLFVHAWTFRNEAQYLASDYNGKPIAEYLQYFALGVDGLFSDFPDTAVKARALIPHRCSRVK